MEMDLDVDFDFSAAHRLPLYEGPCLRMHGHNYKLRVSVRGSPDPKTGMLFKDAKAGLAELIAAVKGL